MNSLFILYGFRYPINNADSIHSSDRKKAKESMSTIQDVSAEQLAKLFHHYREALAEDFNCHCKGSEEASSSWIEPPKTNAN